MMSAVTSADIPADDTTARERLGSLVKARRLELRTSVRAAATKAGVARDTWTGLEEATRRTAEHAYAGIENALLWAPGSIQAILDGGEPTTMQATPSPVPSRATSAIAAALQDDADPHPIDPALIRIMRSPDLTDAQKARIVRALIAEQERFAAQRADELIRQALGEA